MFAASMEVDGDTYLFADEEIQRPAYRDLLRARGCTDLPEGIGGDWSNLYTVETQGRKIEYDNEMVKYMSPEGTFLANLTNHLQHDQTCGPNVPCLCTSSMIHSWKKKRCMLSEEYFAAQGFAVVPNICPDNRAAPWRSVMHDEKFTKTMQWQLAGNGMHCEVVGSIIAYVLARTLKFDAAEGSDIVYDME